MKKQKPELTWIGKGLRPKPELRILLKDLVRSRYPKHPVTDHDLFDNPLAHAVARG